jgi:hypothetical protein
MFDTAELLLADRGLDLHSFLEDRRARGDSYRTIAAELKTYRITVTFETVRAWSKRLGIESTEKTTGQS